MPDYSGGTGVLPGKVQIIKPKRYGENHMGELHNLNKRLVTRLWELYLQIYEDRIHQVA